MPVSALTAFANACGNDRNCHRSMVYFYLKVTGKHFDSWHDKIGQPERRRKCKNGCKK